MYCIQAMLTLRSIDFSHKRTLKQYNIYKLGDDNMLPTLQFYDRISVLKALKLCQKENNISKTRLIHEYIAERNIIPKDVYIATTLITTYARCGILKEAREVFETMPVRSVVSWNALISGYAQNGLGNEALECFREMAKVGVTPDSVTYISILKACGIVGSLEIGEDIDATVKNQGLLQKDVVLGTALVDMYAKCGALEKAQEVFEQIQVRNVVSWSALITGYAQHGLGHEAIKCFNQMRDAGVSPNAVTYACILKSCGIVGCLEIGKDIDAEVRKQGLLEKDVVVGTALVDMYSKCGALERAREVFEQLQVRNVVSWNALISGYVQHEQGEDALKCFRQMQVAGVHPDAVTYVCVLKACAIVKALHIGEQIDNEVTKRGLLRNDVILGTALVDMYSKCNALQKAQDVFERLPVRNIVSWNALITGHAQNGLVAKALECFRKMKDSGVCPNSVTYICILKACASSGSLEIGEGIHAQVEKEGLLHKDVVLGNALIDMYSKCGALGKAREVLEQLPVQDVVSWSALIAGYARNRLGNEALKCFKQMQDAGVPPNVVTFVSVLKCCAMMGSLQFGEDIDVKVRKNGSLQNNVVLGNALVDMYAKCGALGKAQELFEQLPLQNIVSWSTLVMGYAQHGLGDEALKCFRQMQDAGISPNVVTYVSVLKACGIMGCLEIGEDIEYDVIRQGLLQKHIILAIAFVDMYSKCGALDKAQRIFQQIPVQNVVSWNALIRGYIQYGLGNEALNCFAIMQYEGVQPDVVTYVYILKACGIVRSITLGEDIDAEVRKQGLLQKNVELGNALVDMYSKCGVLPKAQEVFEQILIKNLVSWNIIITGYTQNGLGDGALQCFKKMQVAGVSPDAITYVNLLKACGIVGSLVIGEKINAEIRNQRLLYNDFFLGTALVDMYSKCGRLEKAREVFEELPVQNVVSWTAFIAGYAHSGHADVVLRMYRRMTIKECIVPNLITFIILLSACSHAGLVQQGEMLFNEMCFVYGLSPLLEHYTCMVDMFGRAGQFGKAEVLLDKVSHSGHLPLFMTTLGACRKWNNVKLGKWAFEQSLQLDDNYAPVYVCMENIYATAAKQAGPYKIDSMRFKNEVWQSTGVF